MFFGKLSPKSPLSPMSFLSFANFFFFFDIFFFFLNKNKKPLIDYPLNM